LIYPPADYAGAERLLVGARTTDEESGPQDAGRALLVAALAGGGEYGEAMEHARRLSASKPAELVELLRGLRMIHDSIGAPNDQLAQLQLGVADMLRGHMPGMNRADVREVQSARADAYVATARRDEATEIYRQLAAEHPDDARVQHRYAELLLDADTAASPAAALQQWRLVLRKTPARTDEWFQAKYGVALAHYKLGQRAQARQIILVTQSLHPDLGGTAMKQQFLQLMELCEQ
jgi:predicted Zn-dependent protease